VRFTELEIAGALIVDVDAHSDDRGLFARTFCQREFSKQGIDTAVVQCSTSYNATRGTVRGMHWQAAPHEEVKLVRCTAGSIFDVILDVRPESRTFGEWRAVELSRVNRRALYIPSGVAHGFQSLEDESEVLYQISAEYVPEAARGIRWDDPELRIDWPIRENVRVSGKDRALPSLRDLCRKSKARKT
jgi:dTDP-4-dehydrorhamnose 3,5-epimerase